MLPLVLTLALSLVGDAHAKKPAKPAPVAAEAAPAPVAPPVVEDPYLWLEEVGADTSLAWVRERNTKSEGELTANPAFAAMEGRILSIMDSDAKIPYVGKMGKHYYNF